jgi:hypothetical protein
MGLFDGSQKLKHISELAGLQNQTKTEAFNENAHTAGGLWPGRVYQRGVEVNIQSERRTHLSQRAHILRISQCGAWHSAMLANMAIDSRAGIGGGEDRIHAGG